jgi:signal transduction histidine kinase
MGTTATLLVQEISNPLNSMFTTIHRLQRDLDSPAALRSIALDLKDETARLRGLLEKFLSFSRPASANFTTIELSLLLTDLLSPLAAVHTQRGIQIDYVATGSLFIKADQQRLKQALFNICLNGIEAMPQGGKLTVNASASDKRVVMTIIDTGPGVSDGIDIFDLFTTTKFQAMGMGLPIARQIVLDHRGTISYSSEPGHTTFRIDLPAVES